MAGQRETSADTWAIDDVHATASLSSLAHMTTRYLTMSFDHVERKAHGCTSNFADGKRRQGTRWSHFVGHILGLVQRAVTFVQFPVSLALG